MLRLVFNLPFRSHSADLYNTDNQILPVYGLYIYQVCSFIYLVLNNKTLCDTTFNRASHDYYTRRRNQLARPSVVSVIGERSFEFKGVQLYNYLEEKCGPYSSYSDFKSKI